MKRRISRDGAGSTGCDAQDPPRRRRAFAPEDAHACPRARGFPGPGRWRWGGRPRSVQVLRAAFDRARHHAPKLDGTEVIRRIRAQSDVPVIMLTARDDEIDRVVGLELGADDYVTKPFAVRELVARVRAIMRRAAIPAGQRPDELTYDRLKINLPSRRVSADGEEVDLTYTEFELLVTLASSPGRVFSRSALLRRVWGDEFRDERTVDVHIRHLREKIERDPRNPEFIHTARGVGYVFR